MGPTLTLPLKKIWSDEARAAALEARRQAARSRSQTQAQAPSQAAAAPTSFSPSSVPTPPTPAGQGASFPSAVPPHVNPARARRKQASQTRHADELEVHGRQAHWNRYGEAPTPAEDLALQDRARALSRWGRIRNEDREQMERLTRLFSIPNNPNYTGRPRYPGVSDLLTTSPAPTATSTASAASTVVPASATPERVSPTLGQRYGGSSPEDRAAGLNSTDKVEKFKAFFGRKGPDRTTTPQEFVAAMTGGLTPTTPGGSHNAVGSYYSWSTALSNEKGDQVVQQITRTFKHLSNGKFEVHHDYFKVAEGEQAAGAGKKVLRSQMDLYKKIGVDFISVYADINVGKYAWARYGFLPSKATWGGLRAAYKVALEHGEFKQKWQSLSQEERDTTTKILDNPDPRAIWAFAKLPIPTQGERTTKTGATRLEPSTLGKEVMLRGASWDGTLKLNNAEQMTTFDNYVKPKAKPEQPKLVLPT